MGDAFVLSSASGTGEETWEPSPKSSPFIAVSKAAKDRSPSASSSGSVIGLASSSSLSAGFIGIAYARPGPASEADR